MVKRLVSLVLAASVTAAIPVRAAPPSDEVRIDGYAEWLLAGTLIVDGQRVRLAPGGHFRGEGDARSVEVSEVRF